MEVYVVWSPHHAPLEVFTTRRKADALVELLDRDGHTAYVEALLLNVATPDPIPEVQNSDE